MNRNWLMATAAGAFLLLAGCQNTVNSVENADKNMTPTTISDHRFSTDGFLRDRLKLVQVDVTESAAGLMQVQVTAMNARVGFFSELWSSMTNETTYEIEYKFTWLNLAGMAMPTATAGWKRKSIQPGETVYFQAVAPSPDCKDFMLNLREAN